MEKLIRESADLSPAVEIRQLTKSFCSPSNFFLPRKRAPALKNLNLSLKKGEILGLMGPNGSGKTTLLKILCGLVTPDEGEIRIFGFAMPRDRGRVKPRIRFIAGDDRSFYPRLTGRQNLQFFAALHGLPKNAAREKISRIFDFISIPEPDRRYQEYSAGIKQRLSIARGLLSDAELMLLDEPTRCLDLQERKNFLTLIRGLRGSGNPVSMIWATHEAEEVASIADRIAILSGGSVQACGTLSELSDPEAALPKFILRR